MKQLLASREFEINISQDLANNKRLQRALYFRARIFPVLEEYLNPQNTSPTAKLLQEQLDFSSPSNIQNKSSIEDQQISIEDFFNKKIERAKILNQFLDRILHQPSNFSIEFETAPSAIDKEWCKALLIDDLIFYGPISILCLMRIFRQHKILKELPSYQLLLDINNADEISEIRCNNKDNIFFESTNKIYEWPIPFLSNKQLQLIIERIINESNTLFNSSNSINAASPIADFEHPCGYIRGAAVIAPASSEPFLTLRIHPSEPYTLEELQNFGMLSSPIKDFLIACQESGMTIAIAGTMGSGKTTLLSALAEHWPKEGRKATIEDTAELRPRIQDLIKMRTIEYEQDDCKDIDVARLTKACKRHSVRYVVLSEARDSSAWEILQLSQSILGSLMTFHYTVRDAKFLVDQALNALIALCRQHPLAPSGNEMKHQIASIIQVLILIEQDPIDHIRRIVGIYSINGFDELNGGHFKFLELFKYEKNRGFVQCNTSPELNKYFKDKGGHYQLC